MSGEQIITRPTAFILKQWYEDETHPQHTDALHMLAKFLIQGIRARGIFKDEKDVGYLSDVKKAYESYKYCVYNKIFGKIDHADLTFDIVHKDNLDPNDKKKLKDMITEMVKFYKSEPIEYPSMSKSFIPLVEPSCSDTPTESFTLTPDAQKELKMRLRFGPFIPSKEHKNQNFWANDWHAIFTVIFKGPPSFNPQGFTSPSVLKVEPVGIITFRKLGGKSTRRARAKKARRTKRRHTRRTTRRE